MRSIGTREHVRMIVGDLGADVVEDVSLRNTVGQKAAEPPKEWTSTAQQATIQSGESTALARKERERERKKVRNGKQGERERRARKTYKLKAEAR